MTIELHASTSAGRRLVELAERLADDPVRRCGPPRPGRVVPVRRARRRSRERIPRRRGPERARRPRGDVRPRPRRRRGQAGARRRVGRDRRQHAHRLRAERRAGLPLRPGGERRRPGGRVRGDPASPRRRRRRRRGRRERAGPGAHATRHHGHTHSGRVADQRPQDLLHDVARRDHAAGRGPLRRSQRRGALRLRVGRGGHAGGDGRRRLGCARDARIRQPLGDARGGRRAGGRVARRLSGRRRAGLHAAEPHRRAVPRLLVARHRRGRGAHRDRHAPEARRGRLPVAHAGGRERGRPCRVPRDARSGRPARRRARPRRTTGRPARTRSSPSSPRHRRRRRSSTRSRHASSTERSRSRGEPAT